MKASPLILFFFIGFAAAAQLPPFIVPCTRCQGLSTCIRKNLEMAKPFIFKGLPELSIPNLSPFNIPYIVLNIPDLQISAWNVNLTGYESFEIVDLQADSLDGVYKFQIAFPELKSEGYSEIKGRFANFNFDTSGILRAIGTNLQFYYTLKTERYDSYGKEYLRMINQNLKIKVGGRFQLVQEHIDYGYSKFFNITELIDSKNIKPLLDKILSILENSFLSMLDQALNTFFKTYTYNDLAGISL